MAKLECCYYLTESGKSPVREFIDTLDNKAQRKFFFVKSLLEEFGHKLPEPHAKYMGDDIFELRFKSQKGAIRILYFFFHQDKVILTNGFIKRKNKTPKNERELAVQRRREFLNRQ